MLAIRFYDKSKSKPIGLFLVLLTSFAGELLHVDYGMLGVLLIAIFYILRAHKMIMMLVASLILVISRLTIVPAFEPFYYPLIVEQLIFAVGSLLLIAAYNGKLGKSNKYIKMGFYAFYPVHLALFCIIRSLIG